MNKRVAWLVCLLLVPVAASAAPAECIAGASPAALAETFEHWWLAGRLHEDGARRCLERLRMADGDTAANRLRQARRHAAAGEFDATLALAEAEIGRTGLSAVERIDAAVTLADLLTWRDRLDEARAPVRIDLAGADRYLRLRGLLARARFTVLDRDTTQCVVDAEAAIAESRTQFAGTRTRSGTRCSRSACASATAATMARRSRRCSARSRWSVQARTTPAAR